MPRLEHDICRTWLFGPGANSEAHAEMLASGADALILDLEDFTPPSRRDEARQALPPFVTGCRQHGCVAAIRINALESCGGTDLAAAMAAGADVILYPMAETAAQMAALDDAMTQREVAQGDEPGSTEILPVCETAMGVLDVRLIAKGSPRIRAALLGSEDLVNDLGAERAADAVELDYARRRFIFDCRAAKIEPIDAPYTFSDIEGALREARYARRLGYKSKSLTRPEQAEALNRVLTPSAEDICLAESIIAAFDQARARGEDRVQVDGLWVEVPAYRNAQRTLARAHRLKARQA